MCQKKVQGAFALKRGCGFSSKSHNAHAIVWLGSCVFNMRTIAQEDMQNVWWEKCRQRQAPGKG